MPVLHRKLIRDLVASVGTLLTVIAIMGIGTGAYVGLGTSQRILEESRADYYRQYRFADFWISLKKAPRSAAERLAAWPEVASLRTRVVFDVLLDVPDAARPVTGRLLSVPSTGYAQSINGIHLQRGAGFSEDRDEEVILSEAFARAHGIEVGDRLHLVLNRRRQAFTVVGTCISPEYVYLVRGPGDLIPDPTRFGVLYVKERYAREVLDFKDACNEITGQLTPRGRRQVEEFLARADRLLSPYGVLDLVPRSRQASHSFLHDELSGLAVSATVMPGIFLAVAALVLNILMLRLARRQRTTVGTLKALGYSDLQVTLHFLGFGVVVGLLGGLCGCGIGLGLAAAMIRMYRQFFEFPSFAYSVQPDLMLIGLLVSVAFGALGALRGVLAVLRLQPAEAMRPTPPERGGRIALERLGWLWRRLGFRTHLALRSVFRNRVRSLTGVFSAALATAIMFMALVMYDSFVYLVDFQFEQVVRSDVDLGMRDEASRAALLDARQLPGVQRAEPLLGVTCDLRHGYRSRRLAITGLSAGHSLTAPRASDGAPIRIPSTGLVLTRKLAELLDVRVGDLVELRPVRGRRTVRRVPVTGEVDSYLGLDAYADLEYLAGLLGESSALNSLQFRVDPGAQADLFRAVRSLPVAQGMNVMADTRANIARTLVETSVVSIGVMIVFAGVIAFGSTLNSALIEIGDRVRELSTLRVLGYGPAEVAGILVRQGLLVFLAGLLLAFPLGYLMVSGLARAYDKELYRLPLVIRFDTVLQTIGLASGFMLLAQVIVYRQVRSLDWLEGIKVKE